MQLPTLYPLGSRELDKKRLSVQLAQKIIFFFFFFRFRISDKIRTFTGRLCLTVARSSTIPVKFTNIQYHRSVFRKKSCFSCMYNMLFM